LLTEDQREERREAVDARPLGVGGRPRGGARDVAVGAPLWGHLEQWVAVVVDPPGGAAHREGGRAVPPAGGEPQGGGREPDGRGREGTGRVDVRAGDVPASGAFGGGLRQPVVTRVRQPTPITPHSAGGGLNNYHLSTEDVRSPAVVPGLVPSRCPPDP